MPRTAASIQVPAPAIPHHLINYTNGELFWATRDGDIEEPISRLKREEIVFILKRPKNIGGYLVYSLTETSVDKASDSDKPPFELSILFAAQLPEEPLAEFLLDEVPAHLRSDGCSHFLDVIVSTRSGIGQASAFYDGVLHQLFEALGLGPDGLGLSVPAGGGWTLSQIEDAEGSDEDGSDGYRFRYRVTVTKSSTTIREFARGLGTRDGAPNGTETQDDAGIPTRTIVLLSGDGGVIDLLNGLDGPSSADIPAPTVAVLPLGTGNALFHSLHRPYYKAPETNGSNVAAPVPGPSSLVLGLRTLFRGTSAPLPTFRASFSPRSRLVSGPEPVIDDIPAMNGNGDGHSNGSNGTNGSAKVETRLQDQLDGKIDHLIGAIVASYGFHASLVWESDTPAYRVHGDKRFGMAAAELLKLSHAYNASVEVRARGNSKFVKLRSGRSKFNYVLTTMVSNLEKTFTISPASRPLDGQLRLVHFGDVGGEKTMEIMMAAYREGEHVGMRWTGADGEEESVGYENVDEVRVTIGEEDARWRKVCIDGTIVEVEQGGWMAVRRAEEDRLKVLVGRSVM